MNQQVPGEAEALHRVLLDVRQLMDERAGTIEREHGNNGCEQSQRRRMKRHRREQAGISEQTYYQWKKAADAAAAPADLNDLLALEEENKQLKRQLADRLRQENAELKKKLGLK